MQPWEYTVESTRSVMPNILTNEQLARERAQYIREQAEQEQMRQGWLKQLNPQFRTVTEPERQIPNTLQAAGQQPTQTIPATTRQEQVPFVPQNYGEAMAQQAFEEKQSKQFFEVIDKPLTYAFNTGNNDLRKWVSEKALSSSNPQVKQFGELLNRADFTQPKTLAYTGADINAMTPEQKKLFNVPIEREYDPKDVVEFSGKLGTPEGMWPTKVIPSKTGTYAKSSISKDYWKKEDKTPVTFDPVAKKYYDANGEQLTSDEIERVPQKSGAAATGRAVWAGTSVPGVERKRIDDGGFYISEEQPDGTLSKRKIGIEEFTKLARGYKEGQAAAGQAGGAKTAALYRADKLFEELSPKLVKWKESLKKEDEDRVLDLVTNSKTYNELTNKIESSFRDNPKQALLLKNTVLLADALSTVYGAGPGGQWSFEVAREMLDPMTGVESYKTTLSSHGEKIKSSLKAAKGFAKSVETPKQLQEQEIKTAGIAALMEQKFPPKLVFTFNGKKYVAEGNSASGYKILPYKKGK